MTTSTEMVAQAVWTGATNLSFLPVIVWCWRLGLYYDSMIGWMAMLTSALYHICQSLNVSFFGFDDGRYHHMDNVFAIAALVAILFQFAQFSRDSACREIINTASLSVVIVAQLLSPWELAFTVCPLLAAVGVLLCILLHRRCLPRTDPQAGVRALICLACAALCFVKGLDDNGDYLRLWHGGWHVCVGLFCYFASLSANPLNANKTVADKL